VEIHETKVGEVVVLMPEGNLTAAPDCQALDQKLKALLDGRTRQIVVDGTKVGQIGSGAMRVLLRVGHKLGQLGGRMVLCSLSERVRLAFKISGFDNDFTIVSAQERALAKVQESLPAAPPAATPPPKADAASELRERVRALAARTLVGGLAKVAWPPAAAVPSASLDEMRALVQGVFEGTRSAREASL